MGPGKKPDIRDQRVKLHIIGKNWACRCREKNFLIFTCNVLGGALCQVISQEGDMANCSFRAYFKASR